MYKPLALFRSRAFAKRMGSHRLKLKCRMSFHFDICAGLAQFCMNLPHIQLLAGKIQYIDSTYVWKWPTLHLWHHLPQSSSSSAFFARLFQHAGFQSPVLTCRAIAFRLEAGMSTINDFATTYMCQSLPFGGVKHSGFDRFGGECMLGMARVRNACMSGALEVPRFYLVVTLTGPPQSSAVEAHQCALSSCIAASPAGPQTRVLAATRRLAAAKWICKPFDGDVRIALL
eukprot:742869-Pelagomonas_calceolata.AAC.4